MDYEVSAKAVGNAWESRYIPGIRSKLVHSLTMLYKTAPKMTLFARPTLFLALMFCVYGVNAAFVGEFKSLSSAPLSLLPMDSQFLQSSPLIFFLGFPLTHLLGGRISFVVTGAIGFVLFAFAFRRFLNLHLGDKATEGFYLFALSPILLVLLTWFGDSDAYTLGFFFLFAASDAAYFAVVAGLLAILSHREIGSLILLSYAFLFRQKMFPVVFALILGNFLIEFYHYILLPAPPRSRWDEASAYLPQAAMYVLTKPVAHFVYALTWFWFVVLAVLRGDQKSRERVIIVLVATFGLAFVAKDYTRIFTLVSMPLITYVTILAIKDQRIAEMLAPWKSWLPLLALIQGQIVGGRTTIDSLWAFHFI